VLLELCLISLVAKLAGVAAVRLRQPAVIGELLAGVGLGPHALGLVGFTSTHHLFQQLGAIILLFAVGLDTPLSRLKEVWAVALRVSIGGMALPFAGGAALLLAAGYTSSQAIFMGAALVSTSVGVTARVLADLRRVKERPSRVILAAAILDDILGLLVLAMVAQGVSGDLSLISIGSLGALAVGFVGLVGGIGPRLVARVEPLLVKIGPRGVFILALALCIGLSLAAGAVRLAAIIGAFLAGLAFAETRERFELERQLTPVYALLVPFFFAITGSLVDLRVFTVASTVWLGVGVLAVAILGKMVGCGLPALALGHDQALIVGVGMVPRGEVGILIASLGLAERVISQDLYGIMLAVTVATTLLVPPVLARLIGGRGRVSSIEGFEGIGG
jgi:Kef-type K+ transport system membrane component KefB